MEIKPDSEMPICPYCKTMMLPFRHIGYYDTINGWECECNSDGEDGIPGATITHGEYA